MEFKRIIQLTPKEINKFYDINMAMKKIFKSYILTSDGFLYSYGKYITLDIGYHFCYSDSMMPLHHQLDIGINNILFHSESINEVSKKFKKPEIDGLGIHEDTLYFIVKNKTDWIKIGTIIFNDINAALDPRVEFIKTKVETFKIQSKLIDPDISVRIINGEIFNYLEVRDNKEYKLKVSKDLFPILKKDDILSDYFSQNDEKGIFDVILSINRANLVTYHIYKCIDY